MSHHYRDVANMLVADALLEFVEQEALPGTDIEAADFWTGLSRIIATFGQRNQQLLNRRQELQQHLDDWHKQRRPPPFNLSSYKAFLQQIGYLAPEVDDFTITTTDVDPEIALQAGPQLVVPLKNARFALNAANARWGSLYDAVYGTDVIPESSGAERGTHYNPVRGQKVVAYGRDLLDQIAPLENGSHHQAAGYRVSEGQLMVDLLDGSSSFLRQAERFRGYHGDPEYPQRVLLLHHGLHVEICIDPDSTIGKLDPACVSDVMLEAALTTIMDCEDSVAAVDAQDKVEVYRNWLGLMQGNLQADFIKNGKTQLRTLNADQRYTDPTGKPFELPGRSLLFVRNVGHLMTTDAVLDATEKPVPEGIIDGVLTSLIALHDLKKGQAPRNSRTGSVYIVKPKMHGPEEVRFTAELFAQIENMLHLKENTLKIGIMDEERRTTVNLKACIHAVRERVVFINTGFLDRTGDEIHTSMHAGPMVPKAAMKLQPWLNAYERWNVDVGLACGLSGRAQIGKGMWPMPDCMADMMAAKLAHPQAGANTAWVPSPTAATLHAIHYHQVDVFAVQRELETRPAARLDDILTIPLLDDSAGLSAEAIQSEVDNNCQSILGYVVRWVDQGVGCSKVPDVTNIGLMEDRATLRISSQHLANWLLHGVCSEQQVKAALRRMAAVVDEQNAGDPLYRPMAADPDNSLAFQAASALIFQGTQQPSGYTEPLLHEFRRRAKARR